MFLSTRYEEKNEVGKAFKIKAEGYSILTVKQGLELRLFIVEFGFVHWYIVVFNVSVVLSYNCECTRCYLFKLKQHTFK